MAKVTVYTYALFDEELTDMTYEGDVEIGMNQGNSLVVTERVPDVSGKGSDTKMKVIALINANSWSHAEVE
jgi:hypothetical protein